MSVQSASALALAPVQVSGVNGAAQRLAASFGGPYRGPGTGHWGGALDRDAGWGHQPGTLAGDLVRGPHARRGCWLGTKAGDGGLDAGRGRWQGMLSGDAG